MATPLKSAWRLESSDFGPLRIGVAMGVFRYESAERANSALRREPQNLALVFRIIDGSGLRLFGQANDEGRNISS
jgi:hypothetical protein